MKKKKNTSIGDTENNINNTELDASAKESGNAQADPQEEFLKSPIKKKQPKEKKLAKPEESPDWSEDITLLPGEYEDLDDGKGIKDELPEEEIKPSSHESISYSRGRTDSKTTPLFWQLL